MERAPPSGTNGDRSTGLEGFNAAYPCLTVSPSLDHYYDDDHHHNHQPPLLRFGIGCVLCIVFATDLCHAGPLDQRLPCRGQYTTRFYEVSTVVTFASKGGLVTDHEGIACIHIIYLGVCKTRGRRIINGFHEIRRVYSVAKLGNKT